MKFDRFPIEDASGYQGYADAVFTPADEAEVVAILRSASERRVPVTIGGSGTGVTGGRVPQGGWLVSLERLRSVDVNPGSAVAGAGVLLRDLQIAAARTGQFYAPDPTEYSASIGGSIATNASGSRSFRYGDTRRHVLAARVALIDGSVLDLKRGDKLPFEVPNLPRPATTKNTAGYFLQPGMDALDLFVGSEGTLGVVVEATVRLLPAPRELLSGVVFLHSDEDALAAVDLWRTVPDLRMLEYMDAGSLSLLRPKYPDIPADAAAALLIEEEVASDDDVDAWGDRLEAVNALAEQSWFGTEPKDRERFRAFRHALPEVVNETVRRRGLLKMGTDFAVPVSRNAEIMQFYRNHLDGAFSGRYVIFGHIGDAHVHVNLLPANEVEAAGAQELILEMARFAVSLGGTVSAEHGLGKRKAGLLALMFDAAGMAAMRDVKRRLDPHWLLGRGTLFTDLE